MSKIGNVDFIDYDTLELTYTDANITKIEYVKDGLIIRTIDLTYDINNNVLAVLKDTVPDYNFSYTNNKITQIEKE